MQQQKQQHPKSVSFAPPHHVEREGGAEPRPDAVNETFEPQRACGETNRDNNYWQWLYGGGNAADEALFTINVSDSLGEEYRPLFFDIARMVCLHATIQFMSYMGGQTHSFFSPEFVELLLYIVIGTMLFWLVIRKIVWLA
jgi:hypothetical protein